MLAEREHMVTSALAVPVHAGGAGDGDEPASFGTIVRERLGGLGAQGERWASWKDEERGWMVKLEFTAEGIDHDARWSFEPHKQALHPQNADAVTLSKHGEVRGGMIPRLRAVSHEEEQSRFDSGAFTFDAPDFADDDTAPQPELTRLERSSSSRPPRPARRSRARQSSARTSRHRRAARRPTSWRRCGVDGASARRARASGWRRRRRSRRARVARPNSRRWSHPSPRRCPRRSPRRTTPRVPRGGRQGVVGRQGRAVRAFEEGSRRHAELGRDRVRRANRRRPGLTTLARPRAGTCPARRRRALLSFEHSFE